jgi:uncharacterized protein DUF4136
MKIFKTIKLLTYSALLGGILFTMGSCYPDNNFTIEDLDIAISFYDDQADFTSYKTYSLPDSIILLDSLSNRDPSDKFNEAILARIKSNLEDLGYEEEADPENNAPDVLVLVAKVVNDRYGAYQGWDWWYYWGWYPYWGPYPPYGPGWGPGYPWGGGTIVYSYTTGTILIDMLDVAASDESQERIPTVWAGAINGLVEGPDAQINARLNTSIDQLFDQSPYLKNN